MCFNWQLILLYLISATNVMAAQDFSDKKIKLSFDDTALDLVLLDLKISHNLKVEYDEKAVQGIRVTKSLPKLPLGEAMTMLLQGTGLSYELKPPATVVIFKNKNYGKPSYAPSGLQPTLFNLTVSGTVKDAESGETLPFANLLVVGTGIGATTNVDGYFTLFDVPSDTALLEISYKNSATAK